MRECISKFAKVSENALAVTSFLLGRKTPPTSKTRVAFGSFGCPRQTLVRVVDPGTIEGRLSARPNGSAGDGLHIGGKVQLLRAILLFRSQQ